MQIKKTDLELEALVRRINDGELDLQPDFQRGEVWDLKRKQRLIDTILRKWYVPAVHIVEDGETGEEAVLDGQQRLATIVDFFAGRFKVNGRLDPRDERIEILDGKRFQELPAEVNRAIKRFEIQIVRLSNYLPDEPNELFFRLNQSYNLTPPEKRNALHGPARDQVKDLVHGLIESGLLAKEKVGFGNNRLAYDDIVARTCVVFEKNDLNIHINNNVVEEFYRTRHFSSRTVEEVYEAGSQLLDLVEMANAQIKLNKATLQSWLTYCHWGPHFGRPMPGKLISEFESDRLATRSGTYDASSVSTRTAGEVLKLYDDRASYRVTDVSSVLIRDLTIHLYSQIRFGTDSRNGSDELLQKMNESPESTATLVTEFIKESGWGAPILPSNPGANH